MEKSGRNGRLISPSIRGPEHAFITIGVSACVAGERTRYDGGDQTDSIVHNCILPLVKAVLVCPEVELGFPVPREPIQLEGNPDSPRLMSKFTRVNYTSEMTRWILGKLQILETFHLDAFIFKSRSPSCGMRRVKFFYPDGKMRRVGVGLFARAFQERFPSIPVIENDILHSTGMREHFIRRIFILKRFRQFLKSPSPEGLRDFLATHRLAISIFHPEAPSRLQKLLEDSSISKEEIRGESEAIIHDALRRKITIAKHRNAIKKIHGELRKGLSDRENAALELLFSDYIDGNVPVALVLGVLRFFASRMPDHRLSKETYLFPHPSEAALLYHA